jgi:hypothetical protein
MIRNLELTALPFIIWYGFVGLQRLIAQWRGETVPAIEQTHLQRRIATALSIFVLLLVWVSWVNRPDW